MFFALWLLQMILNSLMFASLCTVAYTWGFLYFAFSPAERYDMGSAVGSAALGGILACTIKEKSCTKLKKLTKQTWVFSSLNIK